MAALEEKLAALPPKFAVRGRFVHANARRAGLIEFVEDGLIVVEDGAIIAVAKDADQIKAVLAEHRPQDVVELAETEFLAPGMVDCHVHAPQYAYSGTATDKPLMEWLQHYTFPAEKRCVDVDYAKTLYSALVDRLLMQGTTCVALYATIHVPATNALVDICLEKGLRAVVGKVCMDRHGGDGYEETTAEALEGTRACLDYIRKAQPGASGLSRLVQPCVIPRFIPTCTPELLAGLGATLPPRTRAVLQIKPRPEKMLLLRRASRQALAQRRALSAAPITSAEPAVKPARPEFSSGPCAKRPGWSPAVYESAATGRSHRSAIGKQKLKEAIETTRQVLNIPADYKIAVVPASDTGAIEMAMWSMLGERPVDMCHWESFGKGWLGDVTSQLKLDNVTEITAGYGELPDLSQTNKDHDVVFTFNGTTSGVRVPDLDWIADDRTGLTFNDATSAVFAMDIDWSKVDVTTYSWQKVMGGEGAHGMLILSPRAVERLESFTPSNRPLPKIFRMTKKGKLDEALFTGATINTPSMVCVEDYLDALQWAQSQGGLAGLIKRSEANLEAVTKWVESTEWAHFLAKDVATRSSTSVCLTLDTDPANVKAMVKMLEEADVAYDIGAYRDAPAGLRIWCGATVNTEDLEALFPWIEYAFAECS